MTRSYLSVSLMLKQPQLNGGVMTLKNKAIHSPKQTDKHCTKPPNKSERVLEALTERKLTRFDAEHIGCHCLNSTVSSLRNAHGLTVDSRPVLREGRFGVIHCNEYWIAADGLTGAYKLLDHFRDKRGAPPLDNQKQVA